jgi:hypothetical protein
LWEDPKPEYQAVRSLSILNVLGLRTFKKLFHVEDLEAMARRFGTNIEVISKDFHIAPDGRLRLSGKAADVAQLSVPLDFNEGCSVGLANGSKFTSVPRCPP